MQKQLKIKSIFIKDKFVSEIELDTVNHFGYLVVAIDKAYASECPLGDGYMVTTKRVDGDKEEIKYNFFPDWTVKEVMLHAES